MIPSGIFFPEKISVVKMDGRESKIPCEKSYYLHEEGVTADQLAYF